MLTKGLLSYDGVSTVFGTLLVIVKLLILSIHILAKFSSGTQTRQSKFLSLHTTS